ncbi:MAG: flagellar protein FlaG [Burkholderiales bacterium]|nr:flagellar protein FlaG [Burkholderiales bacterium]
MVPGLIRANTTPPGGEAAARPAPAPAAAPVEPVAAQRAPAAGRIEQTEAERAAEAAETVARVLAENNSQLTIEFDQSIGRAIYRLVDIQTGQLVRQIPSKELLALAKALADDTKAGLLVQTNA